MEVPQSPVSIWRMYVRYWIGSGWSRPSCCGDPRDVLGPRLGADVDRRRRCWARPGRAANVMHATARAARAAEPARRLRSRNRVTGRRSDGRRSSPAGRTRPGRAGATGPGADAAVSAVTARGAAGRRTGRTGSSGCTRNPATVWGSRCHELRVVEEDARRLVHEVASSPRCTSPGPAARSVAVRPPASSMSSS